MCSRETVIVRPGDDLEQITGRAVYANCLVQAIGCAAEDQYLELSNQENLAATGPGHWATWIATR